MSNMPLVDSHFAVSFTAIKCSYHLITFLSFVVQTVVKEAPHKYKNDYFPSLTYIVCISVFLAHSRSSISE